MVSQDQWNSGMSFSISKKQATVSGSIKFNIPDFLDEIDKHKPIKNYQQAIVFFKCPQPHPSESGTESTDDQYWHAVGGIWTLILLELQFTYFPFGGE